MREMSAKPQRRWNQLSLRMLLAVALLGPLLIAVAYSFLRDIDAPVLAIVAGAAMVVFWATVLVLIVRRWFVRPTAS